MVTVHSGAAIGTSWPNSSLLLGLTHPSTSSICGALLTSRRVLGVYTKKQGGDNIETTYCVASASQSPANSPPMLPLGEGRAGNDSLLFSHLCPVCMSDSLEKLLKHRDSNPIPLDFLIQSEEKVEAHLFSKSAFT